jgi:hypothetical protein
LTASTTTSPFHVVVRNASALGAAIPALFANDTNAASPLDVSNFPELVLAIIPTTFANPASSNFGNFPRISINESFACAHAYPSSSIASAVDATDANLCASTSPLDDPSPIARAPTPRPVTFADHAVVVVVVVVARVAPARRRAP